jgi:hypothetical protein
MRPMFGGRGFVPFSPGSPTEQSVHDGRWTLPKETKRLTPRDELDVVLVSGVLAANGQMMMFLFVDNFWWCVSNGEERSIGYEEEQPW